MEDTPLRILYIEDSEADYLLIQRHLAQHGLAADCVRVDTLDTLQAALALGDWDLVLSDYTVPGLDFRERLRLIQSALPAVPVLLVSSTIGDERAVEVLTQGVADFVLKDRLARLVPAIQRCLAEAAQIRARLATEQALRDSEQRYRSVTENIPSGIVFRAAAAPPRDAVFVAGAVEEMTGRPPSAFVGAEPVHWSDLVASEDLETLERVVTDALASRQPYRIEYRIAHTDGSWRWLHEQGRGAYGDDGAAVWIDGVVTDITERKRVEVAWRQSDERLRLALTAARMGVWEWNTATDTVIGSDECRTILGIEDLSARLDTLRTLVDPRDLEALGTAGAEALAEERAFAVECRVRRPDGSRRWLASQGLAHVDPVAGSRRLVGTVQDITELHEARTALEQHRERLEELVAERTAELRLQTHYLQALIDNFPFPVWLKDTEGRYLAVNRANAELCGRPVEAIVGRTDLDLWPHAVAERYRAHDRKVMSTGCQQTSEQPSPVPGDTTWVESFKAPVVDETGTTVGTVGFARDISERKAADAAREAARRHSERLARIRTEFLANMSHEIRTPLSGVLGLARIGYRDSAPESSARDTFGRILESGQVLLGIVNDILDFSKIEAGKMEVESVPLDPGHLVDQAVAGFLDRAAEKGIALRVIKSPDLPASCLGDPVRITQILLNLLSNAIKFTERGSVTLSARHIDGWLAFRVEDTGIGLGDDEIRRLFTPFEQADSSTTRRFGGSGLGLAITRRLVERMAGEIRVASRPGRGSRFEVRLPCVEVLERPALEPVPPAAAAAGLRLAGLRILVAEDNAVNQFVLQDMLSGEGAAVTLVDNGQQALAAVGPDGAGWDLVLMDVQMPEMDGLEATRLIRARAPDLPVIGQTAHALAEEREHCRAAGMVEQLTKPIDVEHLIATVLRHARRPAPAPNPGPAGGGAAPPVDWAALHARFRGNEAFIEHLVSLGIETHRELPAQLRRWTAAGNADAIVRAAENLQDAIGNLMAHETQDLARRTERAFRTGSGDAMPLALELADGLDRLLAALSHHRRQSVPPA